MNARLSGSAARAALNAWTRLPVPVRHALALPLRPRSTARQRAVWQSDFLDRDLRVYIGPANYAGQGYAWARALDRLDPRVAALNLAAAPAGGSFPADHRLDLVSQAPGTAWHAGRVLERATHVIFEAGKPVLGEFHFSPLTRDVDRLEDLGIRTAAVYHGSDARSPGLHGELYPFSPFRDHPEMAERLQADVDARRRERESFTGPVFVTTPDMLDFVPGAVLLPLVVNVGAYRPVPPPLSAARPVVLHAPSSPVLKGTSHIEPVLQRLHESGAIVYRRLSGVPHAEMPAAIAAADVVVDQIVLGNQGVLAAESMAAGRLVIGHLPDHVRVRIPDTPMVEADPTTFADVMDAVLADRDHYAAVAARGPAYAATHHDGRAAVRALAPFLGLSGFDHSAATGS